MEAEVAVVVEVEVTVISFIELKIWQNQTVQAIFAFLSLKYFSY